jgi:hypothetical protein
MFSIVYIQSNEQMAQLARRVLQPDDDSDQHSSVRDWILELTIAIPAITDLVVQNTHLLTILAHTTRLRVFRYWSYTLDVGLSSCLAYAFSSRLTSIAAPFGSQADDCLRLLGSMGTLEDMTTFFVETAPPSFTTTTPISFPRIRRLTVRWDMSVPVMDAARFMFSCEFAGLRVLVLQSSGLHGDLVHDLAEFLMDRECPLDELHFEIPLRQPSLDLPSLLIETFLRSTQQIKFTISPPPASFMDAWNQSSTLRRLHVSTVLPGTSLALGQLLERLESYTDGRFAQRDFTLAISVHGKYFSWTARPQDTDMATFIGHLVRHAKILHMLGIRLVDHEGQTLFD